MEKSIFQFGNPTIENIEFKKNAIDLKKGDSLPYTLNSSVEIKKSATEKKARVFLTLRVDITKDISPFELKITTSANFKWSDKVGEQNVDGFLSVNAPALLLSYIRPYISIILSQAGFPNFNIPFLDFTKGPLEKNNIEES